MQTTATKLSGSTTNMDARPKLTEDEIADGLRQGIVVIRFVRANNTERTIRATLNPALLPPMKHPQSDIGTMAFSSVQPVYDVDLNEWRAFRWDRLLEATLDGA